MTYEVMTPARQTVEWASPRQAGSGGYSESRLDNWADMECSCRFEASPNDHLVEGNFKTARTQAL